MHKKFEGIIILHTSSETYIFFVYQMFNVMRPFIVYDIASLDIETCSIRIFEPTAIASNFGYPTSGRPWRRTVDPIHEHAPSACLLDERDPRAVPSAGLISIET